MGTVIDGYEAVKIGLADKVGTLSEAYVELKKRVDISKGKM